MRKSIVRSRISNMMFMVRFELPISTIIKNRCETNYRTSKAENSIFCTTKKSYNPNCNFFEIMKMYDKLKLDSHREIFEGLTIAK